MSKAADLNFKSTTCRRKGRLLRFQSITSSTSDGYAQRLGNDLWNDSESIATKVCSQIGRKCRKMFESQVEVCIDWTSFNFQFKDEGVFMSNLLIIYYVTEQQSISQSRRSVLNFKFSVLTFLRSMNNISKLCEAMKFQLQPMSNAITVFIKGCCQEFWLLDLLYLIWPSHSTWATWEWQSYTQKNWFKVAKYDESYTISSLLCQVNKFLTWRKHHSLRLQYCINRRSSWIHRRTD